MNVGKALRQLQNRLDIESKKKYTHMKFYTCTAAKWSN
jgi:hypothetical protein